MNFEFFVILKIMGRKALIITFITFITFILPLFSNIYAACYCAPACADYQTECANKSGCAKKRCCDQSCECTNSCSSCRENGYSCSYSYQCCSGYCNNNYICADPPGTNPTPTPAPTDTLAPVASPTQDPRQLTPGLPCGGIAPKCSGSCNIGYFCATPAPSGPCTCLSSTCPGCGSLPTPNCPLTPANGPGSYPICNYTTCSWGCTGGDCCTTWSNWYCFQDNNGVWWERRECQTPASCTDTQIRQGCSSLEPSSPGSSSTNTPVPSATPTPIPGAWTKLKNTSFYSNKTLTNNIPASPVSYDADDDATPYFIISSPGSDPGLVSASSINLGSGSGAKRDRFPGRAHEEPVSFKETGSS